jgi:L-lactate dehydrogenase (cytochrome)
VKTPTYIYTTVGLLTERNAVLAEELRLGMALLGASSLDQLRPEMVNASQLLNEMWRPELPSLLSRL